MKKISSILLSIILGINILLTPGTKVYASEVAPVVQYIDIPKDTIAKIVANNPKVSPLLVEVACKGIVTVATYVATVENQNPGITTRIINYVLSNLPTLYDTLINSSQVGMAFLLKWMGEDVSNYVKDPNILYEIEYDSKAFQLSHLKKYKLDFILDFMKQYGTYNNDSWGDFGKISGTSLIKTRTVKYNDYYDYITFRVGFGFPEDSKYAVDILSSIVDYNYGWQALRINHKYYFPNTDIVLNVEGFKRLSSEQITNGTVTNITYNISNLPTDFPSVYVTRVSGGSLDSSSGTGFQNNGNGSTSQYYLDTVKFLETLKVLTGIELSVKKSAYYDTYYAGLVFDLSMTKDGLWSHGYTPNFNSKLPEYFPTELPESIKDPEIGASSVPEILAPVIKDFPKVPTVTIPNVENKPELPTTVKPPNEIYPDVEVPQAPDNFPGFNPVMPDTEIDFNPVEEPEEPEPEPEPEPDPDPTPDPEPDPDPTPDPEPEPEEPTPDGSGDYNFIIPEVPPINFNFEPLKNTNWQGVFPFCLPWDLKNVIMGMASPSIHGVEPPIFKFEFPETVFGSYGSFELDFKDFEPWAKIVRWFVFIIFVVGLIKITRQIIKS